MKEVQLKFDQAKMAELGLTEDTVNGIVQGSSIRVPLGLFELDKSQKAVVVDGNIIDIDDLKNLAIPVVPGGAGASTGNDSSAAPQGSGAPTGEAGQGTAPGSAQGTDQAAGQAAGGNASVGSPIGCCQRAWYSNCKTK